EATVLVNETRTLHKFVSQTRTALKQARVDSRSILVRPHGEPTLNIRVSKKMLDRAIRLMNAFVLKVEAEGLTLFIDREKQDICAQDLNQSVKFAIVERALQKNKREIREYSWKRFEYDY